MVDPSDQYPSQPSPVEILGSSILRRQEQLAYLVGAFEEGLAIVENIDAVNERIAASPRPELVMSEQVELMPVTSPDELGRINNFIPNMMAFGIPVLEDRVDDFSGKTRPVFVGLRSLTADEEKIYFFMGARGGYDEHHAFAAAHGIPKGWAMDMIMQTHLSQPSFMRMWIVLPELTRWLMDSCLDNDRRKSESSIKEELYVAYQLMSRLVDKNDPRVVKDDGVVDHWYLCH